MCVCVCVCVGGRGGGAPYTGLCGEAPGTGHRPKGVRGVGPRGGASRYTENLMSIPHFLPKIVTPVQQMRAHLFTYTLNTACPSNLLVAPSITIARNVKGTQIIIYAA